MLVPIRTALTAMLTQAIAAGGPLDTVVIGLFTASPAITPDLLLADLTEPLYGGYARSAAVTWGTVGVDPSGRAVLFGDAKTFVPADDSASALIKGWFLYDTTATLLRAVELLDQQVTLANPTQQLVIVPRVRLNPSADFGDGAELT